MLTPNNTPARPIIVFAVSSTTLTPLQIEVRNLLSEWSEVILASPAKISSLHFADLFIVHSCPLSDVNELRKSLAPVVLLGDDISMNVPDSWLVLPNGCTPSSIIRVTRALISEHKARLCKIEDLFDNVLHAQAQKTWMTVAQATTSFSEEDTLAGWIKIGAELLETVVPGLRVQAWTERVDGHYKLHHSRETESPTLLQDDLVNYVIELGNLTVVGPSTNNIISGHLQRCNSSFLIPITGHRELIGWILVSFEDRLRAIAAEPLLQPAVIFIQRLVTERDAAIQSTLWQNAIRSGLDQIDVGLSILDKSGVPMLENRASRLIGSQLGHSINGDFEPVQEALCSARAGTATTAYIDEFAVRVSPWGSLQNGCVFETRHQRSDHKFFSMPLSAWIIDLREWARTAGLQVTMSIDCESDPDIQLPAELTIELLVKFLKTGGWSSKIVMSSERHLGAFRLFFDQEMEDECVTCLGAPPPGISVVTASLGRRVILASEQKGLYSRHLSKPSSAKRITL
jgi:hypothetical protein